MSWCFRYLGRYGTIAGAAIVGVGLSGSVQAQTLPIAGNPQQANAQERDAIRGVREQDDAAARISAQLNGGSQEAAGGATANNMDELLRAGIVIDARDPNRLNVQRVVPNSPAARAGLRPGDVITRVNGSPVTSLTAVAQALLSGNTGALGLQVDRNGQSRQLNVSMPDTSARLAALTQTGGQPGASNTQAPMTVGGAVVPGTGTSATPGPGGVTPSLGTTTAQTAGGQAVAGGQPAGVGQGTATAQGTATTQGTAPAFSSQAGGTSQPTVTTGGTTTGPTTTPFPASAATLGNPTSPGLLVQPNTTSGLPTSTPGVPTSVPGLPTSTPGISPSPGTGSGGATPSITSSQGTVNPSVGGGSSALSGTSGLTPSAVSSSQGGLNPSIGGGTPGTTAATGTGATGTAATGTTGTGAAGTTAAGTGATGSTGAAGSSAAGGTGAAGGGAAGGSAGGGAGGAGAGGT